MPLHEFSALVARDPDNRRWADGRRPTLVEVVQGTLASGAKAPVLALYPVPCDTDLLLSQVMHVEKTGASTALIDLARVGVVRCLMPASVEREVDRKLVELSKNASQLAARRAIWDRFRPHIRVIELGDIDPAAHRAVMERDVTDIEIAALVQLIGRPAWGYDRDLRDTGYAERYEVRATLDMGDLAAGEAMAVLSITATDHVGVSAAQLAARAAKFAVRYPAAGLLVIAVAVLGGEWLRRHPDGVSERLGSSGTWRPFLDQAGELFWRGLGWYVELRARVRSQPLEIHSGMALHVAIARMLAESGKPLSAREIAEALGSYEFGVTEAAVLRTLRAHPYFLRNARGQWQLGRYAGPPPEDAFPQMTRPEEV